MRQETRTLGRLRFNRNLAFFREEVQQWAKAPGNQELPPVPTPSDIVRFEFRLFALTAKLLGVPLGELLDQRLAFQKGNQFDQAQIIDDLRRLLFEKRTGITS